ncbi:Fe-S protein assembly chaperone HscA, partial [Acinetobacter baumannii]
EAESLTDAVNAALELDSDLLEAEELQQIQQDIAALQGRLKDGNAEEIRAAVSKLSLSTDNFAAKRMNRNIQRALTGQSVDNI